MYSRTSGDPAEGNHQCPPSINVVGRWARLFKYIRGTLLFYGIRSYKNYATLDRYNDCESDGNLFSYGMHAVWNASVNAIACGMGGITTSVRKSSLRVHVHVIMMCHHFVYISGYVTRS